MSDTYTSQFSGEEIDSALRAAQMISGASTPAELRKKLEIRGDTIPVSATDPTPISEALTTSGGGINPNLLDNWFFGRPVNQRGQTEWTAASSYTIDRWKLAGSGKISLVDGGIKCEDVYLHQFFEKGFLGKGTYTISVLTKNPSGNFSGTFGFWGAGVDKGFSAALDNGFAAATFTVTENHDDYNPFIYLGLYNTFIAAKLELGSTQTLAHKEGDRWVLNEIPDFGEQLRRCQRHAIDDKYHTIVGQLNYSGDTYYVSVQFPCVMRTTPVITLKEISAIGWGALPTSSAEIFWNDANGFFVAIKDLTNMNNFIGKSCIVTYFASADL